MGLLPDATAILGLDSETRQITSDLASAGTRPLRLPTAS